MSIKQICIIGSGLIGGSLALATKKSNFCHEVVGTSRQQATLDKALALNIIDIADINAKTAVANADIVVMAVPVNAIYQICVHIKGCLKPGAVLTDVGSVKAGVIAQVEKAFGETPSFFVPGHPIAGTEYSGPEAAFSTLFENHRVILTPLANNTTQAVELVKSMWLSTGANVELMSVDEHDKVMAITSHLPHVLAYGFVHGLEEQGDIDHLFSYAAGGFRDFSRIASSDPTMWKDICLHNKEQILQAMSVYKNDLDVLEAAIKNANADDLTSIFTRAKSIRDQFGREKPE